MVANEETYNDLNSSDETNYKEQYKEMKRKLRLLIYVSKYTGLREKMTWRDDDSVFSVPFVFLGKRNLSTHPEVDPAKTVESVAR